MSPDQELDLVRTLAELAEDRPVFHSEQDFQRAVARQVHLRHPQAKVSLEAEAGPLPGAHLDLLIRLGERRVAIELKYLRASFRGTVAGHSYELKNQQARDIRRHDVVKDVTRVETLLSAGYADEGYVVTLTNDPRYWLPGTGPDTRGQAFRIHEGPPPCGHPGVGLLDGTGNDQGPRHSAGAGRAVQMPLAGLLVHQRRQRQGRAAALFAARHQLVRRARAGGAQVQHKSLAVADRSSQTCQDDQREALPQFIGLLVQVIASPVMDAMRSGPIKDLLVSGVML